MFRRRRKKTGNSDKNRYKRTEERKCKEEKRGEKSATNPKAGKKSETPEGERQEKAGMVDLSSVTGAVPECKWDILTHLSS